LTTTKSKPKKLEDKRNSNAFSPPIPNARHTETRPFAIQKEGLDEDDLERDIDARTSAEFKDFKVPLAGSAKEAFQTFDTAKTGLIDKKNIKKVF
jgi:hypothetical protein